MDTEHKTLVTEGTGRRAFFRAAAAAVTAAVGEGCTVFTNPHTSGRGPKVSLGSGDIGLMNYALTLEGLEAEYYTLVLKRPYSGMSSMERLILTDIRDHEIVHREFFRRALGRNAIPHLHYDFRQIDFSNRQSVLTAAQTFEDTGVGAYNGAGHLVRNPHVLISAGKIVSVEARHAAAIRDLLAPRSGSFSPTPLDKADTPASVLATVSPYILNDVDGTQLPG